MAPFIFCFCLQYKFFPFETNSLQEVFFETSPKNNYEQYSLCVLPRSTMKEGEKTWALIVPEALTATQQSAVPA